MAKVTQKKTKSAEASAPAKPVTKPAKKTKTENATPVKGIQKKPVKKTENATPAKVIQKKPVKKTKSVTLALVKREQKKVAKETEAIKKKIDSGEIKISELRKQQKQKAESKRGLIYVAHLPHGFYEEEIKNYFKQFGKVTNVKVGRSRITGNSKGFGYVEFKHPEVAKIAAETMNNYLMFKKRVVAEFVPYEKRPKSLFHGKSSSKISYTIKTRRTKQMVHKNRKITPEEHEKQTNKTISKLSKKVEKLKKLGVDTDLKCVKKLNPAK